MQIKIWGLGEWKSTEGLEGRRMRTWSVKQRWLWRLSPKGRCGCISGLGKQVTMISFPVVRIGLAVDGWPSSAQRDTRQSLIGELLRKISSRRGKQRHVPVRIHHLKLIMKNIGKAQIKRHGNNWPISRDHLETSVKRKANVLRNGKMEIFWVPNNCVLLLN